MWPIDLEKLGQAFVYDVQSPMIFSSGIFLFLFAAFTLIYAFLNKRDTLRILFVTCFSYYFYYKSSGLYFVLLGVVTMCDYFFAHKIARTSTQILRKWFLVASLLVNLGLLCYFKYTNFLLEIFHPLWSSESFTPMAIFLPVGISFFTFQSLSYTIDVYRGNLKPLNRLLDYAFYVSFFPQLVAGPIVRAKDFIPQIRKPLFVSQTMFGEGVFLILCGLFKKAVISDYISVNFVERIFDNPSLYSGIENLFGVYGYSLQIYCDFSGYSDMAIGIALLLGLRFPMNFNSPYKSASVTEFWHRWHISLSSWLRDYLYISLGGNRRGKIRMYFNLFVTMLLGGLWHGASWNFVVWGGLHGGALAVHKWWRSVTGKTKKDISKGWRKVVAVVFTFHFVCLCWIFFRNKDFTHSIAMLHQIFNDFHLDLLGQLIIGYWKVFLLVLVGFLLHFSPEKSVAFCQQKLTFAPFWIKVLLMTLLIYLVLQIKSSEVQPFIYFQF